MAPIPPRPLRSLLAVLLLAGGAGCVPMAGSDPGPSSDTGAAPPHPFAATTLPNGFSFPPHDTVRVMTWNLENFVDLHDNPYNNSETESVVDRQEMEARQDALARVLREVRPDVVVFQETEGVPLVEELVRRRLADLGYHFFAAADRGNWHQNVLVMSRLPLGVVRSFGPVVTPIPGTLLESGETEAQNQVNHRMIVVDVLARPDRWFTLAGVHLKAGRTPRDEGHRRGQLEVLRAELARTVHLHPGAALVVTGDLNMVPIEAEIQLLTAAGGSLGFTDVLSGTGALTHPTDAPSRQLDYLLLNPAMERALVPGSGRAGAPFPTSTLRLISDHLPVVADFRFPPP